MLDFYLSGGASNTNPSLSIGGARSSQSIAGRVCQFLSPDTISGVIITDCHDLFLHTGSTNNSHLALSTINGIKRLIFTPYGITPGTLAADVNNAKAITADGLYNMTWTLSYPRQSVTVSVVQSALPSVDSSARLSVTRSVNGLFDNTEPAMDFQSVTDYRCLYLKNDGATSLNPAIFLDSLPQGSTLYLGFDPSGVGGIPAVLASETTAPSGVVFTQPTGDFNALPVTLGAGQQIAIWLRRTTNAFLGRNIIGDTMGLSAKVMP